MVNGRIVIAPVIEFSSLDSPVFALFPWIDRFISKQLRRFVKASVGVGESMPTVWNNIGCCKIRRSHGIPGWSSTRWSMAGRTIAVYHREREKGKEKSSRWAQQISYGIFPTFSFMQTVRVPRKRSRRENDKSSWLIKATVHYRDGRLVAAARKCHILLASS